MHAEILFERIRENSDKAAFIWRDREYSYDWLLKTSDRWSADLNTVGIFSGSVVAVIGDYSPSSIALFFALTHRGCIFVPLTSSVSANHQKFMDIAEAEWIIRFDKHEQWVIESRGIKASHPTIRKLTDNGLPGLVVFSSGSTGESKGMVHDTTLLLKKFEMKRNTMRTLTFLLFDHLGGINTLLYTASNGGVVITVENRTAEAICQAIESHRVELLPTSPTFLNLLIMSGEFRNYDLSSLKLITYGTEAMPKSTLTSLNSIFPDIRFQQTYGLSELGVLRSKSKDSDSLWVKLGGEGFETKIVDGRFWIRAESAMLGYLNAPDPFSEDGWFDTGDNVEVDGEYVRFLGRESEIINVGGEKVWPAEIESVIMEVADVSEARVHGEPHPIMGNVVAAEITTDSPIALAELRKTIRAHCRTKLESFKVPVKVTIADSGFGGDRFKKMRRTDS
jgi:long-chain acyl-CoA synthetase